MPVRFDWMRTFRRLCLAACWLSTPNMSASQSDASELVWGLLDGDCDVRLVDHHRLQDANADRIHVVCGHGTQTYAFVGLPRIRVISELTISVPVRADRVGMQIVARVVLPRTQNPQTQGPYTVFLTGRSYQQKMRWETLVLDDLTSKLDRRIRSLQLSEAMAIDPREAYIDMCLVNLYTGPGAVQIDLGETALEGVAEVPVHGALGPAVTATTSRVRAESASFHQVKVNGDLLQTADRPTFIRLIDDHGEDWQYFKDLGINAVRLPRLATLEQAATADALDLWIICPPPTVPLTPTSAVHFRRILAWDLGNTPNSLLIEYPRIPATRPTPLRISAATNRAVFVPSPPVPTGGEGGRRPNEGGSAGQILNGVATRLFDGEPTVHGEDRCQFVRDQDAVLQLPLVADLHADGVHTRHGADILIHQRAVLGTECTFSHYVAWVDRRISRSRPETVHWVGVDTELPPSVVQQVTCFGTVEAPTPELDQIRILAHLALSRQARGVYFRSGNRLDADDPVARKRSLAIRRATLDLELMEPWFAAGRVTPLPLNPRNPEPRFDAAIVQLDRASLVTIVHHSPTTQYCPDVPFRESLRITLPGSTEADHVFELSAAGMKPLFGRRVPGGVEVETRLESNLRLLLVSRHDDVVREMANTLNRVAHELTEVHGRQISGELQTEVRALRASGMAPPPNWSVLRDDFFKALGQRNFTQCHRVGVALLDELAEHRYRHWCHAVERFTSPSACALATQTSTRDVLLNLHPYINQTSSAVNLLRAGDCDSPQNMVRGDWQFVHCSRAEISSHAKISLDQPYEGSGCLELTAGADKSTCQVDDECALIWVNSPATTVRAGQVVRIAGWVSGSIDTTQVSAVPLASNFPDPQRPELLIFDSLAGPTAGLRVPLENTWTPFVLFRVANSDTALTVTLALVRPGTARIDGLSISPVTSTESVTKTAPRVQLTSGFGL